jgi:NAD(P)-dependent dehydrogenase (short-subunit alcohol dehydrogenase family)
MNITGNTILITGGGSGIGRGLAESLHAQGNQVIIAGRRKEVLEETAAANEGMKFLTVDIEEASAIREFASKVTAEFPALNVLINNAGIMRAEDLKNQQDDLADAESIVVTNLLGPIRLSAALLPHLRKQALDDHQRFIGTCVCSAGADPDVQRDQSCDPFVHALPAVSIEGNIDRGSRDHSAVRADRSDGRRRGSTCDASEGVHCRDHGAIGEAAYAE